jgi:hypothetical protein
VVHFGGFFNQICRTDTSFGKYTWVWPRFDTHHLKNTSCYLTDVRFTIVYVCISSSNILLFLQGIQFFVILNGSICFKSTSYICKAPNIT